MPRFKHLLVILFLCGCSAPDDGGHTFRTYRENGIKVAETAGGPRFSEELFRYKKVLELIEDPGREESMLYRPAHMVMDEDGNIYVADEGNGRVAMFDSKGQYMQSFGRAGEGPGEFRSITLLGVHDDLLSAYDVEKNRTTRVRVSGELLDVTTIPPQAMTEWGATRVVEMHLLDDGKRVVIQRRMGTGRWDGYYSFRAAVMSSSFDTLWTVSTPSMRTFYTVPAFPGFSATVMPIEYGSIPDIEFAPGWGLLVSYGDKPELTRYEPDGSVADRIRIDMEPEPVTASDRAKVTDQYDKRISELEGANREYFRRRKEALVFADEKPFWTDIVVDDSGFIWMLVSESQPERGEAGGNLYRVLSPEGEYLGNSRWPTTLARARVSFGHLLFFESDGETGESVPVVYRITPAVQGLRYP